MSIYVALNFEIRIPGFRSAAVRRFKPSEVAEAGDGGSYFPGDGQGIEGLQSIHQEAPLTARATADDFADTERRVV